MNIGSKRSCDVLIIGGGSAGLRAAIRTHDAGANVLIISKVKRGDPHTVYSKLKLDWNQFLKHTSTRR